MRIHLAGHCHRLWLSCLLCLAWRAFFARKRAGIAGQPYPICRCYSDHRYAERTLNGDLYMLGGEMQVSMQGVGTRLRASYAVLR